MIENVVSILSPHVSFSEAILPRFKGGDSLCVGGEVISISSYPSLGETVPGHPEEEVPAFDIVQLDDGVGELSLMIPLPRTAAIQSFQVGDLVLAQGYLYDARRDLNLIDVMIWKLNVWRQGEGFGDVICSPACP